MGEQLLKEVINLSADEAAQRVRKLEREIRVLAWDLKMNQIHPARLHDLRAFEEELRVLTEQAEVPQTA